MTQSRTWEDVTCTGIMLILGGIAGAGSFAHIRDVAAGHGQVGWIAYAIAGSVDLLAVGSGLEIRRRRRLDVPARWPVFTLLLGVSMTLGANLDTAGTGPWGAAVAVWPAVAFLAVAGLFETRKRAAGPVVAGHADTATPDTSPALMTGAPDTRADTGADTGAVIAPDTGAVIAPDTAADTGADTEPDPRRPRTSTRRTPRRTPRRTTDADTAARVARLHTRRPDLSSTDLAAQLGVSDRTVRRHLAARTADAPHTPPLRLLGAGDSTDGGTPA